MFKISRVEKGKPNYLIVKTPDGSTTIEGADGFVTRMVKDMFRKGSELEAIFREQLEGITKEEVAKQMREAGFPENIVQNFEKAAPAI